MVDPTGRTTWLSGLAGKRSRTTQEIAMAMRLRSPAFEDGSTIPRKYTRDGENRSPPLEWSGAPPGTRSFLVVMEDPDAPSGMFRHWAVYNVPPGNSALPEGAPVEALGINDFGRRAYDGPEPPKGHGPHRYHIRVAALDIDRLPLRPSVRVVEVWEAAEPHVLDQAEMVGVYRRG
jgi:Raf kinase inhibitor-like YbhB/YbcL family protein